MAHGYEKLSRQLSRQIFRRYDVCKLYSNVDRGEGMGEGEGGGRVYNVSASFSIIRVAIATTVLRFRAF